jgi:hypothetical protein
LVSLGVGASPAQSVTRSWAQRIQIGAWTNTCGPIQSHDRLLQILEALNELGYRRFEPDSK